MARARTLDAPPLALVGVLALLATAAPAHAAKSGPYVALGDSFTAAPLVPNQVGRPIGCGRSDRNYPSLVRAAIAPTAFADASCSSAKTEHMSAPQTVPLGVNPPQFDALRRDAELVTIGIGGNDVGLVEAALTCLALGAANPTGTACRSHFATPDGGDRLVERIAAAAPRIAATLRAIGRRAPRARVLVVGYPAVAPTDGRACHPVVPMSADDLAYLDGMLRRTNATIARQARATDVEFVDTYDDSIGHDVCTAPGTRWFEGLVPTSPALSVHPNALGEASMARSLLRVLARPRIGRLRRSARHVRSGGALRLRFRLDRAVAVPIALQRSRGGGRYTRKRRIATVAGALGDNGVTLTARRIGRRAGLYRISATPAGGATRATHVRIVRPRRR